MYAEAERLAEETGGHYLDQFTNAERATDWRGNNNIAESIYAQMGEEAHPIPEWIVVGAGTGGTSATIGRYIRYRRYATRLCVVDPENSAFFPAYAQGRDDVVTGMSSRIEGIGRPRVEPSFPARRGRPHGDGSRRRVRSPPHATSAPCSAAGWDRQRVRICGVRSACWPRWLPKGAADRS